MATADGARSGSTHRLTFHLVLRTAFMIGMVLTVIGMLVVPFGTSLLLTPVITGWHDPGPDVIQGCEKSLMCSEPEAFLAVWAFSLSGYMVVAVFALRAARSRLARSSRDRVSDDAFDPESTAAGTRHRPWLWVVGAVVLVLAGIAALVWFVLLPENRPPSTMTSGMALTCRATKARSTGRASPVKTSSSSTSRRRKAPDVQSEIRAFLSPIRDQRAGGALCRERLQGIDGRVDLDVMRPTLND